MSKLKQKSLFNIESAALLIEKNYYCSSVHCSYYSCFQLLKFTIKDFFELSYNDIESKISLSKMGSHKFIINYIEKEIKKNTNSIEVQKFKRSIKDLKHFRTESDYENIEVNYEQSKKAYNLAEEIRGFLTKTFHV